MEKENRGGARENSGRKKVKDPGVIIAVYPRESWVNKIGKDRARVVAIEAIENEYKKYLKKNRKS